MNQQRFSRPCACDRVRNQHTFLFWPVAGSFAGLVFLSWYLAGKITVFDRRGHVAKLCVVLMPLLLAVMVAISRVDDYWQDVCTGGVHGT
jgi:hypothetical protein